MEQASERTLTRTQLWLCFGILVGIFLLFEGPVWRHPWNIDLVNGAIIASYLPLPLLVIACLAWSRKLAWVSFLLETLRLTLIKYGTTFAIALALWTLTDSPREAIAAHPSARPPGAAAAAAPVPLAQPSGRTVAVRGRVLDAAGQPAAGALVFVAGGEEPLPEGAAPLEPLVLENDGTGVRPAVAVARTHQPIPARSTDGRLHTLVAETDEASLFNVPAMRSGAWSRVTVDEPHRPARLRCTLHASEAPAHLVVLAHSHFAIADAEGRFEIPRVPAGRIEIRAWRAGAGAGVGSREADFRPATEGARASVDLAADGDLPLRLDPSTDPF